MILALARLTVIPAVKPGHGFCHDGNNFNTLRDSVNGFNGCVKQQSGLIQLNPYLIPAMPQVQILLACLLFLKCSTVSYILNLCCEFSYCCVFLIHLIHVKKYIFHIIYIILYLSLSLLCGINSLSSLCRSVFYFCCSLISPASKPALCGAP